MASGSTDVTAVMTNHVHDVTYNSDVTTTGANNTCIPELVFYNIVFYPLILITLIINMTLFVAAAMDREKLRRQTYLFAAVGSALISNVIYLIFFLWILVDNYAERSTPKATGPSVAKMIWVFLEAATISSPFCICWNIVTLILVTVNSATYVGRVAHPENNDDKQKFRTQLFARLSIAFSWMVPFVLIILAMAKMNCVSECWCPSTNFKRELCPVDTGCSHFWAPVTSAFIYVCVALWFVAMIVACLLVGNGIWKYQRTVQPHQSKKKPLPGATDPTEPVAEAELIPEHAGLAIVPSKSQRERDNLKRRKTRRSLRHRLNSRLRFALTLTIVFAFCCLMFVTAVILDTNVMEVPHWVSFTLSRLMMYIYTTTCPIIMVIHLPVLKSSLLKLFHSMKSCCKATTPTKAPSTPN